MMSQVSKAAAVQMALTAGVANTLKAALSLIGGPAGLAIITGYSLYKLADSHNVAKRAGKQHAETLSELKQALENTVQEVENLNDVSKNEAIASWSKKLKDAEQNIKDLEKSLKNTGGMSWYQRLKPDFFKEEWEIIYVTAPLGLWYFIYGILSPISGYKHEYKKTLNIDSFYVMLIDKYKCTAISINFQSSGRITNSAYC